MSVSGQKRVDERTTTVFLDASVFIANALDFEGPLFKAVVARAEAADIELVIPEVTRREVCANIAESVREAEQGLAKFRKSARVLRPLSGHPLAPAFADLDWDLLRRQIEERFSRFLEAAHARVLAVAAADGSDVLDDYFDRRAPFGRGKKKCEFPDAFAVRALLRHAAETKRRVTVVSTDPDWKAACDQHDRLEYADSLDELLEHTLGPRPLGPDALRSLLERHRAALEAQVLQSFRDRGFFWDSDEAVDAEVVETFDEEIVSWDWAVIDQDEHYAEVAGDAEISFGVHVTYPDPDMCAWDSEDKEMIVLAYETARLSASATVPVTFRVDLDELREGELNVEDLTVNDNADVWIDNSEVEETWSTAD